MNQVKCVCLTIAMLCAIPCFGNKISFDGSWKNKQKSIIIDLPLEVSIEEIYNVLQINFHDNLGLVIKEDNGSDKNWNFKLGVNIKGINYGVDASIPFNNNDDEIVETIFDRAYINSKANTSLPLSTYEWGIWKMYSEGGVAYSLPISAVKP